MMTTAPKIKVEYHVTADDDEEPPAMHATLPASLRNYFEQRRRALITELRQLEQVLGIEQSIPKRDRPH